MSNDIEVLEEALAEYKCGVKLRKINEELYEQLYGSIQYVLNYSKKNDILLPNRKELESLLDKSEKIMDKFNRKFTEVGILRRLYRATKQYSYNVLVPYYTVW